VKTMSGTTFDFDQSVAAAWARFAARLAEVLSMMDDTEPLTLVPHEADDDRWYVRFVSPKPDRVTAIVPANWQPEYTWAQAKCLERLGWRRLGPATDYERTINQGDCLGLADDVVEVLRQVFTVDHPVFLGSDVLAEVLQESPIDEDDALADTSLDVVMPADEVHLTALVTTELARTFGSLVMRDGDGSFAVRVGSTMLFIRIPSDCREVRLSSVVVHDISGRSRAAEVLNDVNAHARWVKFYLERDKIIATLPVAARPFVPAHFRLAVEEMSRVVDGVDDLLAASLEGKVTFSDGA